LSPTGNGILSGNKMTSQASTMYDCVKSFLSKSDTSLTATEIAKALGVTKSEVNSVLYANPCSPTRPDGFTFSKSIGHPNKAPKWRWVANVNAVETLDDEPWTMRTRADVEREWAAEDAKTDASPPPSQTDAPTMPSVDYPTDDEIRTALRKTELVAELTKVFTDEEYALAVTTRAKGIRRAYRLRKYAAAGQTVHTDGGYEVVRDASGKLIGATGTIGSCLCEGTPFGYVWMRYADERYYQIVKFKHVIGRRLSKVLSDRCGIEVLGMRPNATGSTFSRQCHLTVCELKERCRWNGVSIKGLDKKGLMRALMRV